MSLCLLYNIFELYLLAFEESRSCKIRWLSYDTKIFETLFTDIIKIVCKIYYYHYILIMLIKIKSGVISSYLSRNQLRHSFSLFLGRAEDKWSVKKRNNGGIFKTLALPCLQVVRKYTRRVRTWRPISEYIRVSLWIYYACVCVLRVCLQKKRTNESR